MFSINDLNKTQLEIAKDTEGAILVTAGAGSGKTRLLTHRICYIIEEKHINPENIIAITFTNKATNEMRERIEKMLPIAKNVWVSTFHAMCVRILRSSINHLEGYTKYFTKRQKRRHEVLPGISGWAQVNGRNDVTIKDKINSDLYYVDNISFLLDLKIVFKTIAIVFKKTGASISEKGISEEIEELKKNKKIVDPEIDPDEKVMNL